MHWITKLHIKKNSLCVKVGLEAYGNSFHISMSKHFESLNKLLNSTKIRITTNATFEHRNESILSFR